MGTTDDAIGRRARAVIRACDRAVLATALEDGGGWPYGSLVLTACDGDGSPILLVSTLAVHTRNMAVDGRISLLYDGTAGLDDPLTGPRVTVLGRVVADGSPAPRARFLSRHPSAAAYADFADFGIYRVAIERAHMVAGFGEIVWIAGPELRFPMDGYALLMAAEADIVAHMNADHSAALDLYATVLLGRAGAGWAMTGIDPEGCDLRCGGAVARLDFDSPVAGPAEARKTLAALARESRDRAAKDA
jgi:putative heme iron utilization protein